MHSSPNRLGANVREALQTDAPRISALAAQLGYPISAEHAALRLAQLGDERRVFVAVVPRVGVVGWIGVSQARTLTSSNRVDIEGLVVEDEYRGNGIGELLLHAAERWASQRECGAVRVLSNVVRDRAHRFYERLGYDVLKTEYVFEKTL